MLPKTADDAISWCYENLGENVLSGLAALKEEDLITTHFGLGRHLRNEFRLWDANKELLESIGKSHPDDASSILIRKLWEDLRQ